MRFKVVVHPSATARRFARIGRPRNSADSVLGVYRDEMDHPETKDRGPAELTVLKKRQLDEDVGTMRRLVWVGELQRLCAASVTWRPQFLKDMTPVATIMTPLMANSKARTGTSAPAPRDDARPPMDETTSALS